MADYSHMAWLLWREYHQIPQLSCSTKQNRVSRVLFRLELEAQRMRG